MPTLPNLLHHHAALSVRHNTDATDSALDVAIDGFCSHCREQGEVRRYRLSGVGLRYLDAQCSERLTAMGMRVDLVEEHEPRKRDRRGWLRWPGVLA